MQQIYKKKSFKSIWGSLCRFRRIGIALDCFFSVVLKGLRLQSATRTYDPKKKKKKNADYFSTFHFSPHFPNAVEYLFPSLKEQKAKKALMFPSLYIWKQILPNEHTLKRHGYTPPRKVRDSFPYSSIAKPLAERGGSWYIIAQKIVLQWYLLALWQYM